MLTMRYRWSGKRNPVFRISGRAVLTAVFTVRRTVLTLTFSWTTMSCRSRADRIREGEETFVAMRRKHPAVESAINTLEHRGLDRVRAHGSGGFERFVGLSVLTFNIRRRQLLLKRLRPRLPLAA